MACFNSGPLSFFDASDLTHLQHTPAYTGFDGIRHPAGYTEVGSIEGDLQDISADELTRDTAGIYHAGDARIYTSAELAPQDRIRESTGPEWEVVAFVSRSRLFSPARNEYLLRRIDTTEE